ncbi:hypothetical protein [Clostridium sp. Marseille-P2415]|nr:hypothetical protein [Clostridium sp. Marseille-P2415]
MGRKINATKVRKNAAPAIIGNTMFITDLHDNRQERESWRRGE